MVEACTCDDEGDGEGESEGEGGVVGGNIDEDIEPSKVEDCPATTLDNNDDISDACVGVLGDVGSVVRDGDMVRDVMCGAKWEAE